MKLAADEGVDRLIVSRLREAGHDVWYACESDSGLPDSEVLARARRDRRVLITADKDFGELVFRRGQADFGVLLLRLVGLSSEGRAQIVLAVINDHAEQLGGAFAVVRPRRVRIRRRRLHE